MLSSSPQLNCFRRSCHWCASAFLAAAVFSPLPVKAQPWKPLAQEHGVLYASPDPENLFAYSPGLCVGPDGSLVATIDLGGPAVKGLSGPIFDRVLNGRPSHWQGRVLRSVDGGKTWGNETRYPFMHARPFVAGDSVYVLGQADDLMIIRSDDGGQTWTEPKALTRGQNWHQAPANVHYANGCVYLVMEQRVTRNINAWYVAEMAPVLMRAKVDDDLTRRESWTFADALSFLEAVNPDRIDYMGIPFFPTEPTSSVEVASGRNMSPVGWLETNVVQLVDPDHIWTDPSGRTFHLLMRAHTGSTGYAAIAKVVESGPEAGEGAMSTMLEQVPSGKDIVFVPMPGGQMKFHVSYDDEEGLFWLLSTQATDSMTRADRLPADRYGLPNNERRRLQLHYSRNTIDWIFAGIVAAGEAEQAARHYASMVIEGDDLLVLSRSGDVRAKHAHDVNLITFHRIADFRELVDPAIRAAAKVKITQP